MQRDACQHQENNSSSRKQFGKKINLAAAVISLAVWCTHAGDLYVPLVLLQCW
jgi:hypothetical protein